MKICVHNCGLPEAECKCLLGSSDANIEALQQSLGAKAELDDETKEALSKITEQSVDPTLPTGFSQIQEQLGIDPQLRPGDLSVTFGVPPSLRETFSENVRGLCERLLVDSKFSSALARYNPQAHPVGLVLLKEDGRQMSPEEMEAWIADLRKLPPATLPGGNISSADLARYLAVRGNDYEAFEQQLQDNQSDIDLVNFSELERRMSEEQLRMWQLPTPELIRELESQGVDCDLLRMYPHEVKPLDLTRISSQCRNNDIAELYPKTFTIKNLGGNYQRLRPRYVYKGRTKRGPRRFRLQIVTRKEKACTI